MFCITSVIHEAGPDVIDVVGVFATEQEAVAILQKMCDAMNTDPFDWGEKFAITQEKDGWRMSGDSGESHVYCVTEMMSIDSWLSTLKN